MCYWVIFHWIIFLIQNNVVCVPQAKKDIQPQKLRECLIDLAKNRLEHQTVDRVFCIDSRKRSVWQSFFYTSSIHVASLDTAWLLTRAVNFKFSEIYFGKMKVENAELIATFLFCTFSSFGLWWSGFIKWVFSVTFLPFVSFVRNIYRHANSYFEWISGFYTHVLPLFLLKPITWFFCT